MIFSREIQHARGKVCHNVVFLTYSGAITESYGLVKTNAYEFVRRIATGCLSSLTNAQLSVWLEACEEIARD